MKQTKALDNLHRILIIQTAFIGDVILATALMEKLHENFPSAKIDFLLRQGNERLLRDHPYINNLLVWNKQQRWRSAWRLLWTIRKNSYDLVVNVQRYATTGMLTIFSRARITAGFDKNPLSRFFTICVPHRYDGIHELERNQKLIAHFTGANAARPRLYPGSSDHDEARKYIAGAYVTISPASVWNTKQLPKEKWIELAALIPESYPIYLLGSTADRKLCDEIAKGAQRTLMTNLAGKLDLLPSAVLMRQAEMNYVNDSSPMHLASSMNAPVTAVFCSTVPQFGFTPVSDKSFVVETHESLSCRPCGLHGYAKCPEGHFLCAKTILIDDLIRTLIRP